MAWDEISTDRIRHGFKTEVSASNSAQKKELKCSTVAPGAFQIQTSQMYNRISLFYTKPLISA